uniref:Uncharacterized protein n=1 Tax=Arundo donax TaxID=35708 RepID=A0A0A9CXI9_ARUDO
MSSVSDGSSLAAGVLLQSQRSLRSSIFRVFKLSPIAPTGFFCSSSTNMNCILLLHVKLLL